MTTPLFWVAAAGLLALAVAILLVPLLARRNERAGLSRGAILGSLAVVPAALGLYFLVTSYDVDLDYLRGQDPAQLAALEQLAARLGVDPDDPAGWILLGRSYLELGDYALARRAMQEAWSRTAAPGNDLKLLYAESMLLSDPATGMAMAGDLIDQVLAEAPGNQQALWWGGLVAVQRNQRALAVERWSALLATNPPADVADVLREQIAALTAGAAGSAGGAAAPAEAPAGPVLAVDIEIAPGIATGALGPNAIVYLAARAPDGGPPLAARQIPLSAVPGRFELGVADAMIPGRTIAGHERVTVVARISLSGTATEQPGDVYGQVEVEVASGEPVRITIDTVVPSV